MQQQGAGTGMVRAGYPGGRGGTGPEGGRYLRGRGTLGMKREEEDSSSHLIQNPELPGVLRKGGVKLAMTGTCIFSM